MQATGIRQDDDEAVTPASIAAAASIAATLTSEAELKAWYLASNPTLRSMGLSCPPELYKEMRKDLRVHDSVVKIIPWMMDPAEGLRMSMEFFDIKNPNHQTCRVRELCPNAGIMVLTATSNF